MNLKQLDYLAKAISLFLHPLLIPTLTFILIYFTLPEFLVPYSDQNIIFFISLVFITTYLLPVLTIYGLYLTGLVKTLYLDKPSERIIALGISIIFYSFISYFLYTRLRANQQILLFFLASVISMISGAIVTAFEKISLHTIAITGMILYYGSICFRSQIATLMWPFVGLVLAGGFLMSARLYLNKHTPVQVLYGFILAVIISGGLFFIKDFF